MNPEEDKERTKALEYLRSRMGEIHNPEGMCEWLESLDTEHLLRLAREDGMP